MFNVSARALQVAVTSEVVLLIYTFCHRLDQCRFLPSELAAGWHRCVSTIQLSSSLQPQNRHLNIGRIFRLKLKLQYNALLWIYQDTTLLLPKTLIFFFVFSLRKGFTIFHAIGKMAGATKIQNSQTMRSCIMCHHHSFFQADVKERVVRLTKTHNSHTMRSFIMCIHRFYEAVIRECVAKLVCCI